MMMKDSVLCLLSLIEHFHAKSAKRPTHNACRSTQKRFYIFGIISEWAMLIWIMLQLPHIYILPFEEWHNAKLVGYCAIF